MPNWILNLPYRSCRLNFHTSLPSRSKQASSPLPTKAQTCLPSVLGEADAPLPSSERTLAVAVPSFLFQRCLPSVPTHINTRASPSCEVRKIRSPQTTGVEPPMPGSVSVQATFFEALHLVGRPVSELTPSFVGPRHCGQLSAAARPATT